MRRTSPTRKVMFFIYTYQDLQEIAEAENDSRKMEFTRSIIAEYKRSELYQNAILAKEYDRRRNRTIVNYRKFLYTMSGQTVPDNVSANYKIRKRKNHGARPRSNRVSCEGSIRMGASFFIAVKE